VVKPLRVVHEDDERRRLGHLGKQAEDREGHEEALRRLATLQSERHPQSVLLRLRQRIELAQHRRAQLVQPGERQLHLGLHAGGARDAAAGGALRDVLQQRGLAYACLARTT